VSFFTFQALSYVLDVRRGKTKVRPRERGDLARDADHAHAVGTVGGDLELEDRVVQAEHLHDVVPDRRVLRQHQDPGVILRHAQLGRRTQHPAAGLSADLALRDLEIGQPSPDLRVRLELTFEEAVFGTDKELEITRSENCLICDGTGAEPGRPATTCVQCGGTGEVRRIQQSIFGQFVNVATCQRCHGEGRIVQYRCKECGGSGRVRRTRRVPLSIPAGVDTGTEMRGPGQGEGGERGGPNGNLYVQFQNIRDGDLEKYKRPGTKVILAPENLRSGELQLVDRVATTDVAALEGDPQFVVLKKTSNAYSSLNINIANANGIEGEPGTVQNPLADAKVREAFELSLDREQINEIVYTLTH
jgi:hypothetical protein